MRRTDKSVSFLTGMIIAALYVVLLVSFSRETYVIGGRNPSVANAAACADPSRPGCSLERPVCTPSASGGQDATCMVSIRMLRHLMSQSGRPLSSDFDAAAASSDDRE